MNKPTKNCEHAFSALLGRNLGVELVGYIGMSVLIFKEMANGQAVSNVTEPSHELYLVAPGSPHPP
jgi:hypothetical protein